MEDNYNKITNNIWLGNKYAALDSKFIKKNNIKRIINITPNILNYNFPNVKYLRIPIETIKLKNKENKFKHIIINTKSFNKYNIMIYYFIEEGLKNKENILIHCKKGHTRSAISLLYYLINKCKNITQKQIIKYIQNKRDNTFKNYTYIIYFTTDFNNDNDFNNDFFNNDFNKDTLVSPLLL
jgi:hypothetical protein